MVIVKAKERTIVGTMTKLWQKLIHLKLPH